MLKFWKTWLQNREQLNNAGSDSGKTADALKRMRKRVVWQAGFAVLTITLTVVLIFAMTAAWYTNVVQTSGLIFEVEQWGVSLDTSVYTTALTAAPGDEGIVGFEVGNTGEEWVTVSVSTTKTGMDAEMQKRLYFYVDAQQTANGETVQRFYLNSRNTYDYLLFGNSKLTLTEAYHNDAQLKWCWVYDVLGYYVLAEKGTDGTLTVSEYLRPIEYDYDEATFEDNGALMTVDGTTTVDKFLTALSENDGYAGTIDTSKAENGYYPIEVDDNGNGVYVYLCDYAEIEAAIDFDTQLGAEAAAGNPGTYTAKFTIYAENSSTEAVTVGTADALSAALTGGNTPLIRLTQDVTLADAVTLPAASNTILDLNGHTLTTDTSDPAITAPEGSSLVVANGELTGAEGSGHGLAITGADVVLKDVDLSGYVMGVRVLDHLGTGQDSVVRMIGCSSNTSDCAVFIQGNGAVSEQSTKLIIENCEFYSTDIVICGNGSANRWGTDIQIIGSAVTSDVSAKTVAIYHPQADSVLNVANSTVTGFTGIAIKGGTLNISNSKIIGAGTEAREPSGMVSGVAVTGDAVYVETNYDYRIHVTADAKTELTSYYNYGLRVYEKNSPYVTVISEATENDKTQAGQ